MKALNSGDCVQIPDGRIGRLRDQNNDVWRVRVRRKTSESHQFLFFTQDQLKAVACPKGWMSPQGYNKYLRETLTKIKEREKSL